MPIQCAEGQTPTPAKLAASHAAADEPAGLALNFPHTSLFIQVLKRLERKIVEMLRSSMSRRAES
jgi:hypothetical protein